LTNHCCNRGLTGPDCDTDCSFLDDDFCTHPDAIQEAIEEGEELINGKPLCGHLCCI